MIFAVVASVLSPSGELARFALNIRSSRRHLFRLHLMTHVAVRLSRRALPLFSFEVAGLVRCPGLLTLRVFYSVPPFSVPFLLDIPASCSFTQKKSK